MDIRFDLRQSWQGPRSSATRTRTPRLPTSMNSHVIRTETELHIEERPEAYK